MMIYQKLCSVYGQTTAQILMTKKTVIDGESRVHARNTFNQLFKMGIIPIVNENDSVATYDIEFGDNDRLSAVVAALVKADLLLLLSDIDGIYTDDPHKNPDAVFISEVDHLYSHFMKMAKGTTGSGFGTGGMATKLIAAEIATSTGSDMVIANADDFRIIHRIIEGEHVGTIFMNHPREEFYWVDYLQNMRHGE